MPRRPNLIPTVERHVRLPIPTDEAVSKALFDPRLGRMKFGAFSELITTLLEKWLETQTINPLVEQHQKEKDADAAANL